MPGLSLPGKPTAALRKSWNKQGVKADDNPFSLITPGDRLPPWQQSSGVRQSKPQQRVATAKPHSKKTATSTGLLSANGLQTPPESPGTASQAELGSRDELESRAEIARDAVDCLLQQPKREPRPVPCPVPQTAPPPVHQTAPCPIPQAPAPRKKEKIITHEDLTNSALRSFFRGKGRISPLFKQVSDAFVTKQQRQSARCASSRSDVDPALLKARSRTDLVEVRMLPPTEDAASDVNIVDLPEEGLSVFRRDDSGKGEYRPHTAMAGRPKMTGLPIRPRAATSQGHNEKSRGITVRDRLEAAVRNKLTALHKQQKESKEGACELAKSCRRNDNVDIMKVAPNAWLQQQNWRWGRTKLQWEMPEENRSESKDEATQETQRGLTVFEAFEFAERLNLPAGQVTEAWKLFKRYDADDDGRLSPQEFQLLLRNILRDQYPSVKDIPRALFEKKRQSVTKGHPEEKTLSFSDFLTWLTEHAFDEAVLLTEEQRKIRRYARLHRVPIPVVEVIKRKFDQYDNDGSGHIEFHEFYDLLCELLGMSHEMRDCLPQRRVRTFWSEVDHNGSGLVEFDEFIPWYLRYFDPSGRSVGISPLEEYYASIRPFPHVPHMVYGE